MKKISDIRLCRAELLYAHFFSSAASSAISEMAGGLATNRISLILSVRITIAGFPYVIGAKGYGMFEFYYRKKRFRIG